MVVEWYDGLDSQANEAHSSTFRGYGGHLHPHTLMLPFSFLLYVILLWSLGTRYLVCVGESSKRRCGYICVATGLCLYLSLPCCFKKTQAADHRMSRWM